MLNFGKRRDFHVLRRWKMLSMFYVGVRNIDSQVKYSSIYFREYRVATARDVVGHRREVL